MSKTKNVGLISALIVDDNAFDRRRLMRLASETKIDFFIKQAANSLEFAEQISSEKFDIIFVDLYLPDISGVNLLPIVRADKENKDTALVMITGESDADTALNALRDGFADYIVKDNLSVEALERATLNAVQKTRLRHEVQSARNDASAVEAQLKKFSDACISELSPLLVRMLRQLRQLKTDQNLTGEGAVFMRQLEDTCNRMHEFLEDLGALAANNELHSVVGVPPAPEEPPSGRPASRKGDWEIVQEPRKDGKTTPRLFRKRT